jgi:hypothetical protein
MASLAHGDFSAYMLHNVHQLFHLGRQSYTTNGRMRGAVLVGFTSIQEMEVRVRDKSLNDAMMTYAESMNPLQYNPEQEVYVVIGITNATKTRMERCLYENTLSFYCPKCDKTCIPDMHK